MSEIIEISTLLTQAKHENEQGLYHESLELLSKLESTIDFSKDLQIKNVELLIEIYLLSSLNYYYLQMIEESISFAQKAIDRLETESNKELLSKAFSLIASNLFNKNDFQLSLEYVNKTLKLRKELDDKNGYSQSLYLQGNIYNLTGMYQEAIDCYKQSLQIKEELSDNQGVVSNYIALGSVHKEHSEYSQALDCYYKAIEISLKYNYTLSIANAKTNIGIVHHNLGDFSKSLEYYLEALPLFQQVSNDIGISNCYNSIGLIYSIIGEYDKSFEFYFKSLEIKEKIQNKHGIATLFNNLGTLYLQLENSEKALEYFQQSLKIRKEMNDLKGIASSLHNLGNVHLLCSRFQEGIENLTESLEICEQINDKIGTLKNLIRIGTLYANKNYNFYSPSKAEEFLRNAENQAVIISYKIGLINVFQALSNLYETIGMFEIALENHKKAFVIEKEYFAELAIESTRKFEHRLKIEESLRERKLMESQLQEQERLLFDILPSSIAKRILKGEKTISEHNQNICILFADIVGFTEISQTISSDDLVQNLNKVFQEFDRLAKKHSVEKIKTIGDSYMAISGIQIHEQNPSYAIAQFAVDVLQSTEIIKFGSKKLSIRIGIHIGNIISGVIGSHKYSYDIWGDAVNIASRMESYSLPGRIHITKEFADSISNFSEFVVRPRGEISIKGKGTMNTFWLERAV